MLKNFFSTPFARHEVRVWLANPATWVFVSFAWALLAVLGFEMGHFFAGNRASMEVFLGYVPWVYALVLPALCMGLWAEDWRRGSAERLLTLPVSLPALVVTRFIVVWGLVGVILLGTWPLVACVAWLGSPDWGMMASGYVGAMLLAGVMVGFALVASSLAGHAVVAFVIGLVMLVVLLLSGWSWVLDAVAMMVPAGVLAALREVSVLEHFRRFTMGVVDVRSVTYFAGLMAVALGLNMCVLLRKTGRGGGWDWLLGSVLTALLVSGMGSQIPLRGDWTAEGQFTLSPASEALVGHVQKPLTITVYDSRTNPDVPLGVRVVARRLHDVLREVVAINPDMVRVVDVNPDLNVADEVVAQEAGLVEQPLETGQGYYLGVVVELDGRRALIPALDVSRLPYLEFDLMSVVAEVQKLGRKTVSVLAVPNVRLRDLQPVWLRELEGYYNMNYVLPGQPEIPAGTDVLIVMMAPYLPQESLYAIDQYVVGGGRVMMLMDPYFRTAPTEELKVPDRNADAFGMDHPADLLHAWGVDYDGLNIVADPARAATVNEPEVGFQTYPFWLQLGPADINADLPFTSYVESLNIPEAGRFTLGTLAPNLAATPVLMSSNQAQLIPRAVMDGTDPQLFASKVEGQPMRRVLAMMLAGRFGSVFQDIPPAVRNYYADYAMPGVSGTVPVQLHDGVKDGAILAIADEDFVDQQFTVKLSGRVEGELEPMNDNLVFFFNALQYLAGEGELLSLRGKAAVPRTFTTVEAMLVRLSNRYAKIERKMAADMYQVGAKLQELKKKAEGDSTQSLRDAAQAEVRAYQTRNLELRKQLREVRKALRRDVLMVEKVLLVFGAVFMPFVVGVWWWGRRGRR